MATCRCAIGEVLVQLAEASHDTELDASIHGSVSSGLSGHSTPLDCYLHVFNNMENPPAGQLRPHNPSGGRENPQVHVQPPLATAGEAHGGPSHSQQSYGGARPRANSGGRNVPPPMSIGHSAVPPQQPDTGRNRQIGNRDNRGNRARDNSSDDRRRSRNSSGSRDRRGRHRGYDRSHSPPSAALDFERQNVLFLLGLI